MGKRLWFGMGIGVLCLVVGVAAMVRDSGHGRFQSGAPRPQGQAPARPDTAAASYPRILPSRLLAGVVEGFYGPRWSYPVTQKIFQFMEKQGLNTFVYAPKNVPYLRAEWNVPYPASHLRKLGNLVAAAHRDRIEFICSVSPGLSIQYSSAADRALLVAKINELWSVGIHNVMLSFDDIPTSLNGADAAAYHGSLGLAQCSLVNSVEAAEAADGHQIHLFFTPTTYWGVQQTPYWRSLRDNLDAGIPVIWTGPFVLSASITAQEAESVRRDLGHPLIVWDNYPVNDYTYVIAHHPQLFLGPVERRGSRLPQTLRGYLFNPMLQPYASEIALATGAAYLRNASAYHAAHAWQKALETVGGKGGAAALGSFAGANSVSFLSPDASDRLPANVKSFWSSYGQGKNLENTALDREFTAWARNGTVMQHTLSPALYQEIKPWVALYRREGALGAQVAAALQHPQTMAPVKEMEQEQQTINNAADQLGVHQILAQWFSRAFSLLPAAR